MTLPYRPRGVHPLLVVLRRSPAHVSAFRPSSSSSFSSSSSSMDKPSTLNKPSSNQVVCFKYSYIRGNSLSIFSFLSPQDHPPQPSPQPCLEGVFIHNQNRSFVEWWQIQRFRCGLGWSSGSPQEGSGASGVLEASRDVEAPLCSQGAMRDVVSGTSREHLGNAFGTFENTNMETPGNTLFFGNTHECSWITSSS